MTAEHDSETRNAPANAMIERPGSWRFVLRLAIILVALCACIVGLGLWFTSPGLPSPPVVAADHLPQLKTSLELAIRAVNKQPTSAITWGRYGMLLRAHDFEQEANLCFKVAMRLDPRSFRWPYFLGVSIAMVDPERALEAFRLASELAPTETLPRFREAEMLMDFHRLSEARTILDSLPEDADPTRRRFDEVRWIWLTNSESDWMKKSADAGFINWLEPLKSGPNRAMCLELLAQVFQRIGNTPEALRLSQLARESPTHDVGWDDRLVREILELRQDSRWQGQLAESDIQHGRLDQGLQKLNELMELYPHDPEWPILLMRYLLQSKRLKQAQAVANTALPLHLRSAELRMETGNLKFLMKELEEARRFYEQALTLKPDYSQVHFNLGQVYLRTGHLPQAKQCFRDALQSQGDLIPALLGLAELLVQSPMSVDHDEARRQLNLVLKLAPGNLKARELLTKLP